MWPFSWPGHATNAALFVTPVRCARADLVTTETLPRAAPDWTLPAHKHRAVLCGWQTDRRTATFTVIGGVSGSRARVTS